MEWMVAGHVLFRKRITRVKLLGFLAAQAPCVVAVEACAGAHDWAREIGKLGHHVRLIAPTYVKPFIKWQKNDAADERRSVKRPSGRACASFRSRPTISTKRR
jgi:transposase